MKGKSVKEVRGLIGGGRLNTPSSLLGMLAMDKLRELGYEE